MLPVLGRATDPDGMDWLRVALPGRPNGATGWIPIVGTSGRSTPWRLTVSLRRREVAVWRLGILVHRYPAVVGAPSTPTPRGRFFIEETMSLRPRLAGSPFALATSGRSDVLRHFDGGPGQIALHGRGNLWGPLGSATSHGCIHMPLKAMKFLYRWTARPTSVHIA